MKDVLITLMVLVYNMALLVGATYLVIEYQWSMWVYFLVILLTFTSVKSKSVQ